MVNTDIAGEGQEAPVVEVNYRASLGSDNSPVFETREEARDWITATRTSNHDYDSDSSITVIVVED